MDHGSDHPCDYPTHGSITSSVFLHNCRCCAFGRTQINCYSVQTTAQGHQNPQNSSDVLQVLTQLNAHETGQENNDSYQMFFINFFWFTFSYLSIHYSGLQYVRHKLETTFKYCKYCSSANTAPNSFKFVSKFKIYIFLFTTKF